MTAAAVLGDPAHFSVKAGPNPHTRTRWGRLKTVDRDVAVRQWKCFREQLESRGVRTHVISPDPNLPGLVYPANAGIRRGKTFYPAHLLPARAGERPRYESFFKDIGFDVRTDAFRELAFEGEADFFPWGNRMIFTHGKILRQRFVPAWRFPFYKRVYGFRSDIRATEELRKIFPDREIIDLELCDERYYHGDTCLCSFGARREYLMAYLPALTENSRGKLLRLAGDRLITLSDSDAENYAANAYAVVTREGPSLFLTVSASSGLKREISALGVAVFEVEVSEFLKKGGGSVKCMVFDLSDD